MEQLRQRIANLIAEGIGLKAEEISADVWNRALNERLTLTGTVDLQAYYNLLSKSPYELQELVERLIVPETWFFRDKAAFEGMVSLLRKKGFSRLLSVPCSTGEEPYSMAMAMLDAGFASNQFRVDAADISKIALLKAEQGNYTRNSFRGRSQEFRGRYFDAEKEGFRIKKEVRKQVHFSYGNICQPSFLVGKPLYDVILCRNLLIYLHPDAQKKALDNCSKLLTEAGGLIVAPAEAMIAVRYGFVAEQSSKAFLLRKQKKTAKVAVVKKKEVFSFLETPKEEPIPLLEQAKKRADRGDFAEAEMLCKQHLQTELLDAGGYFLLGVIRHARGDDEDAENYFMKAVYLDPNHGEALMYLALLAEARGDERQAKQYRKRIRG